MRTAIITGASRGVGRSLAIKLCEKGWHVIGIARNKADLEALKSIYPETFTYISADLSESQGVRLIAESLKAMEISSIDLLINNAGAGLYKKILEHSVEDIERIIYLNLVSPIILTKTLLPFLNKKSIVVFIVSAIIHIASRELPIYGAAKIGLHYVTKILREELDERGLHVLTVYPGYVKTGFHVSAGGSDISRGVTPDYVADKIIDAINKKKKVLYVPPWISIARILGPYLPMM